MGGRWRRKWEADLQTGEWSPLPTRVVSNEEYLPLPQTAEQARVATLVADTAARNAPALGLDRRQFLASSMGLAAAFLALDRVFGPFFDVRPVEALDAGAGAERLPPAPFVFDIQTHHVAAPRQFPGLLGLRRFGRRFNPDLQRDRNSMEDLYLANYIKEVFLDSDTTVALLSGIPSANEASNILPPRLMAETRELVNRLAASQRMLVHGLIAPNQEGDREAMARQAADLRVDAWKGYTGARFGTPAAPWALDDEKVGYPMLESARKLGRRIVCLHKGLPFADTPEEPWHPRDLERAARDFPDLTFIAYHAGFRSLPHGLAAARDGFRATARVDWVTDLCEIRERNPGLTNVYAELGSTFGMLVITAPLLCAHVLGMLIKSLGTDHVLWGTDSIWWGSPRWQIEAFRRFTMPESLMTRFGYAPLTDDVKARILGLNAARVFGVDPAAHRNRVPADFVSRLK
ncbi:MAG TPA: amidohydrolase family protein, partial [Vicinamibacteria bacterium]|nr:amidohydrolase family protein [Vicinamibacteria bacterium]